MENKEQLKKKIRGTVQDFVSNIKLIKIFYDGITPGGGDVLVEVLQEELEKMKTKAPTAPKVAKAMLSQPIAGKTDEEIAATREKAIGALVERGYEVVDTLLTDEWYSKEAMKSRGVVQIPLCFLAKSLEYMSLCHAAYFCKGWENARGCKIEHDAAVAYGLEIIYEE